MERIRLGYTAGEIYAGLMAHVSGASLPSEKALLEYVKARGEEAPFGDEKLCVIPPASIQYLTHNLRIPVRPDDLISTLERIFG